MRKIRLIALDVDGTLLDDRKRLPPENRDALLEAAQQGILISMASGRMVCTIEPIEAEVGVDCIIIAYNGGQVMGRLSEGRPSIFHQPIPIDVVDFFIRFTREHDYLLNFYHGDQLDTEDGPRRRPFMELYTVRTGAQYHLVDDLAKAFPGVCPTKLILLAHQEERDRLHDEFRVTLEGRAFITKSEPEYLEITAAGVNKGNAIPVIAERYGVPTAEIMAVGDAENDIGMLRAAGLGVAMANASPQVKAEADVVTERTNNEAGAAEAIRRWALGSI